LAKSERTSCVTNKQTNNKKVKPNEEETLVKSLNESNKQCINKETNSIYAKPSKINLMTKRTLGGRLNESTYATSKQTNKPKKSI
jgi:hypothetical protein